MKSPPDAATSDPVSRGAGAQLLPWLLAAVVWMAVALQPELLTRLGIGQAEKWFLDSHALLAAVEAHRAGMNPDGGNPLDVLGRPHSYSDWWFALGWFELDRSHNFLLGLSFLALFIAGAALTLRPQRWRESACLALVLVSPPLLLAVQRANNDLVVFFLLSCAGWWWRTASLGRQAVAWGLIALAVGLKYYPVAAAALWLTLPSGRIRGWSALLGAALLGAAWLSVFGTLGRGTFGLVLDVHKVGMPILLRDLGVDGGLSRGIGTLGLLAGGWWLGRRGITAGLGAGPALERERALFVLGAGTMLACFLAGVSHGYRVVLMLLLLPWLWRGAGGRWVSARLTLALIASVVWLDGLLSLVFNLGLVTRPDGALSETLRVWRLASQPVHWLLMLLLAGWILELAATRWREWRGGGDQPAAGAGQGGSSA